MKLNNIKNIVVSLLLRIIPRSKNVWITGKVTGWSFENSPPVFFDNAKYFYLYLVNNTDEKVYWITNSQKEYEMLSDMNLPVVKYNTLYGKYLVARAKYSFHHYGENTINKFAQLGSTQIDFWHGTPLKKVAYDVNPKGKPRFKSIQDFMDRKGDHYLASTSLNLSKDILAHAFDLDVDKCLNFGYPRTDILKCDKSEAFEFCEKYSKDLLPFINMIKNQKVYLYMPTFRDDDYDYFDKANIDYKRLNDELLANKSILFLKLHPLTKKVDLSGYSQIVFMSNDVDIYPFLVFTDYLITDYSSIFFDFLNLDREILFIPYDLDNYLSNREMYFEYRDFVPGVIFEDFDDFINTISDIDKIDYSKKRNQLKQYLIQEYNFDACERTYKYFKGVEK